MPSALPFDVRKKIVSRRKSGQTFKQIAKDLGCSESGAKKIMGLYKQEGEQAYKNKYSNCGRFSPYGEEIREEIKDIRDNRQGGDYVYSKLVNLHPDKDVPSARTMTNWWQQEGTNRERGRPTDQEKSGWSENAHDVWQLDGKEKVELQTGEKVSWLNMADEGTAAHLKASVQPCKTVSEMCAQQIVMAVNGAFSRWGLPKRIKIDNGQPLKVPKHLDIPTFPVLWWIGLGIEVTPNRVRRPQENGIVENLQGTLACWTNPKGQASIEQLQKRLDEESEFQRDIYQLPKKGKKTRKQLHPELYTNPRTYNADNFDIQRVYKYLEQQVWYRRVGQGGRIRFYNMEIYIGKAFKHQQLTITFDPINLIWMVRDKKGTLLKTCNKNVPTQQQIKEFALGTSKEVTT